MCFILYIYLYITINCGYKNSVKFI